MKCFHFLVLSFSAFVSPLIGEPASAATDKWEKSIAAFEATDKTTPPPANGIEFVGSSTMVKWKTLKEDFPTLPVFNRGFGGSQSSDVLLYAERIILPYKPKTIVFYAGDNDLAAGKTADQVIDTWKQLMAKLTAALPETKIYYLALRPSVKRAALFDTQKKVNQAIAASIEGHPQVKFVDVFPALLDAEGKPNAKLLVSDMLHLNSDGYQVLTKILTPLLAP